MRLPQWFAERAEPISDDGEIRVSTLELFFDLVFVFTVTQLTTLLTDGFSTDRFLGEGALQALLVFGVIWWMYSGYAWLTNTIPPVRAARRVLLLLGMTGFLVVALAIPSAFGSGGPAFALGYLLLITVHAALYLQATTAFWRVVPFNVAATALIFLTWFVPYPWSYLLWAGALVLLWGSPYFIGQKGFPLRAAHIVERHGLLIIVVLGESVIAIGIGAHGHAGPGFLVAAALGLAVAACLWWVYFGGDDETAAEHALARRDPIGRTRLILGAYFYAHMPMLLGVVAAAAGVKKAVEHPFAPMRPGPSIALAVGIALFLAGHRWYRRVLGLRRAPAPLIGMAAALLSGVVGLWSAAAQLAAVLVLLVALLVAEHRGRTIPAAPDNVLATVGTNPDHSDGENSAGRHSGH
ncbi:low temperature requirement protein A [Microtetraspora malaysiensis]|uniref:low temperature requirement protein A n=1 Tax=Microtetraspora malaysiensis TaxID=161358 RepID=UPI003D91D2B1